MKALFVCCDTSIKINQLSKLIVSETKAKVIELTRKFRKENYIGDCLKSQWNTISYPLEWPY